MASDDSDRWKDLNITKDEVDRLGKALKDEKFRNMFVEYAEEISDPKNRELYEQEIAQMEADRGMDVQFIHPKPGHVVKVMLKSSGASEQTKAFINICHNEHIAPPTHEKKQQPNGRIGLQWSIPHSFSPAREDVDKKKEKCSVFDVVFHPDTYKMASNPGFQKMIHDTAFEGLEKQFGVQIDRQTMVKLKNMQFKGRVEPTIMRKKKESAEDSSETGDACNKENDPLSKFPYPYENGVSSEELAQRRAKQVEEDKRRKQARVDAKNKTDTPKQPDGDEVTVPECTITNQYGVDMADYSQSLSGAPMARSTAPSALVVSIHLPKLTSAAPCKLDVTERNIALESTDPKAAYKLSLKLPYPVDDENGSAKFDKTKKRLIVTLPVHQDKVKSEITEAISKSREPLVGADSTLLTDTDLSANTNPLIEVLSSSNSELVSEKVTNKVKGTTSSEQPQVADPDPTLLDKDESGDRMTNVPTINSVTSRAPTPGLCLDNKISYKTPKLTCDQDEDSVYVVLDVPRVTIQSFKTAHHENVIEVMFSTVSQSGFVCHYYLQCSFPSPVTSVSKDVADKNVVLTITKMSKGFWESFHTADQDSSMHSRQEHKLVTKDDIRKELEEMGDRLSEAPNSAKDSHHTPEAEQMKEGGEKKLHLIIDAKTDEDALPTAPEVVHHNTPSPNIQGILKRTFSESSGDDLNGSGDAGLTTKSPDALAVDTTSSASSPPLSDLPSPRERKKSVSFSDKVEEAMFKSKDSVCHMHKTLLNRRKKQRQRENRSTKRSNSSTERSSGDEHSSAVSKKSGGRRRRHSSSTSDDGVLSPRSADEGTPSPRSPDAADPMTSSVEGEGVCTCVEGATKISPDTNTRSIEAENAKRSEPPADKKAVEPGEALNSDDEEEGEDEEDPKPSGVTNWSDTGYVEKTKCAFDFNNSVIFDLDE